MKRILRAVIERGETPLTALLIAGVLHPLAFLVILPMVRRSGPRPAPAP